MNVNKVIFAKHCERHGLTKEDIVYAAENPTSDIQRCLYGEELYLRFTGLHLDALVPEIEVALKVTAGKILVIYHANAATPDFFDTPFDQWIRKNR